MGNRNRAFQPMTRNTGDLAIGIMRGSVSAEQGPGYSTDYNNAAALNAAHVGDGLKSLGALRNSTLSMKPTFKEHKSAYPQILDFKIAELLAANYKLETEEIGSAMSLALIDKSIDTLETGTPHFYAVEALSEFATGGTLSLFSPYCQLKPTLNMDFGDDFSMNPFEFESLTNPNYTNQELVYRTRANAAARSIANQAATIDVNNLGIGMFQVRIGKPARRAVGAGYVYPNAQLRKLGGTAPAALPVGTATGTYTGGVDGAFILTCTDATADSINFTVTAPDGIALAAVEFTDANPVLLGQGVSLAFNAPAVAGGPTYFTVGDVYVIGAYADAAQDKSNTQILSPYSFLSSADSVGAIKSASLATNPTFKEHFSGYPKVKDLIMLESSTIEISTALEEINAGLTPIVKGYAVNAWDMVFDASVNGELYYVPVEIVMNLATGGVMSFWFPNCQVTPEADFAPSNDWASMPFKLDAQLQGASSSVKRIYRQTYVPAI